MTSKERGKLRALGRKDPRLRGAGQTMLLVAGLMARDRRARSAREVGELLGITSNAARMAIARLRVRGVLREATAEDDQPYMLVVKEGS